MNGFIKSLSGFQAPQKSLVLKPPDFRHFFLKSRNLTDSKKSAFRPSRFQTFIVINICKKDIALPLAYVANSST